MCPDMCVISSFDPSLTAAFTWPTCTGSLEDADATVPAELMSRQQITATQVFERNLKFSKGWSILCTSHNSLRKWLLCCVTSQSDALIREHSGETIIATA